MHVCLCVNGLSFTPGGKRSLRTQPQIYNMHGIQFYEELCSCEQIHVIFGMNYVFCIMHELQLIKERDSATVTVRKRERLFSENLRKTSLLWSSEGWPKSVRIRNEAEQNAVLLFLLNIRSTQKVARWHLAIESRIFEHKSGNQPLLWHRHKLQHQGHLPHQQR